MADDGARSRALEHDVVGGDLRRPAGLAVRARFDRVLRGGDGLDRLATTRRAASSKAACKLGAMLSGGELQVPIYALHLGLAGRAAGASAHDHDADVVRFDGFKSTEERDGVLETLRVAAALADAGRFPIHPGSTADWCDYRSACRRGHPPTRFREGRAARRRGRARLLEQDRRRLPTLAAVRREDGAVSAPRALPRDHAARTRAATDFATNLVVSAGRRDREDDAPGRGAS